MHPQTLYNTNILKILFFFIKVSSFFKVIVVEIRSLKNIQNII